MAQRQEADWSYQELTERESSVIAETNIHETLEETGCKARTITWIKLRPHIPLWRPNKIQVSNLLCFPELFNDLCSHLIVFEEVICDGVPDPGSPLCRTQLQQLVPCLLWKKNRERWWVTKEKIRVVEEEMSNFADSWFWHQDVASWLKQASPKASACWFTQSSLNLCYTVQVQDFLTNCFSLSTWINPSFWTETPDLYENSRVQTLHLLQLYFQFINSKTPLPRLSPSVLTL